MSAQQKSVQHDLLTPRQVSERLQIGRDRTYSLIRSGVIPSITIGSSIRVSRVALEGWVLTASGRYLT